MFPLRALILCLSLLPALIAVAEPEPEVEPAPVDVRASVMRMLQDARRQPAAPNDAEEFPRKSDLPAAVSASEISAGRVSAADALARRPGEERPDWFDGTVRSVPAEDEVAARGDYVPVRHKTITVNSLDDLKKLQEEFAAGRRRKGSGAESP